MADERVVFHFRIVIVILLLQKTTGCQDACSAVGLDDSSIIPDSSFTANSQLHAAYAASKARFSSKNCWEPNGNNGANHYLQIDLGKVFVICAVATKGNAKSSASEWTTEYKISTSSDGNLWITYSDNNNSPKLFPGNTNWNTAVKNDLVIPVLAKWIRFTPTQYNNYKALRVEVYGIDVKDFSCKSLPVGVASVAKIPDNSMTSSSRYNTSTPPSNGRLGYTAGSSWCAATSDSSPYLQVKMSSPYIICGIATQGDHKSDQWVQTYQIQTSTDGSSFTDYKHNNVIKDFAGNTDSNTIVKNLLYEGTVSQYIRINAKSDFGTTSCMRTEMYGVQQNTVCSKMSVGVPYSSLVPNHRFFASSFYSARYIPSNARLRTTKAWEPKTKNVGDWLQIDLGFVVYVCAVATQGNAYPANEYVKKYKLRISLDNVNWRYYQENNADKVFIGNTDRTTIKTNTLAVPTKTKFIRFYPTVFNGFAAMRVDVYGVPAIPTVGGVTAAAQTSQSILVTWQVPRGARCAGFSGYKVIYSKTPGGESHEVNVNGVQNTSHTLNQLEKYTSYSITVKAGNDKGYVLASVAVVERTSEDKPDAAPQNFVANAISSKSFRLSWVVPPSDKRNGIIKGYKLSYCKTGHCSSPSVKVFPGTSTVLGNLAMYTQYTFKVLAYTSVGDGPYTANITNRTLEGQAPSAPINVKTTVIDPVGSTGPKVKIEWNFPSSPNGKIKGYKVSYGKTGDEKTKSIDDQTFSFIFDACGGLRYIIKVWAYSSKEGAKAVKSVDINDYVPDPPKDITSVKRNKATYKISWQAVPSTNGRILVYEIKKLSIKNSNENKEMINISCSEVPCGGSAIHDCSYSLHNTQQCLIYQISIRAYSTKGPGPFSNHLTIQSPVRGTPEKFTVISVDQNSVSLKWEEPENLNIPVKNYTVKYSGQTSRPTCPCNDSSLNGKVITNSTKFTITRLYPATRYRFTVSATTECGEGKDSEEQVNQTKPERDGKKGQSHEDSICTTEKRSFYISLSFNLVLLVMFILLLVYIRYLKNRVSVKELSAKRNYEEKTSPQPMVYENTRVDGGLDGGIPLSDIPTTISQVYDSIDQYQNTPPPTIPSTPHGKGYTSASDLPSEVYQSLDISQQNQGSVYEQLNQTTKAEVPLSSGQSGDSSNYQPLTLDVQNSPYQRLHMDDKSASHELRI